MHRNVPHIKWLEMSFSFSYEILKPSKIKCSQEGSLEAQPSLRALLAAAFPEVPVRPTQASQLSENQAEIRPHVWFVALKWQITLCLSI